MVNRMTAPTLTKFLTQIAADQPAVAASVRALAGVAVELSATIARPDSTAQLGAVHGSANADGDDQKKLDVLADEMITTALAAVDHVAVYLSE